MFHPYASLDAPRPRAGLHTDGRTRRFAGLIAVLWLLSLADLCFTLWAHRFTPFHEVNPVARALLGRNLLPSLVLMKVVLTAVGATIFWRLRGHGRAEAALWGMVVLYVLLAVRWSDYTASVVAMSLPVT